MSVSPFSLESIDCRDSSVGAYSLSKMQYKFMDPQVYQLKEVTAKLVPGSSLILLKRLLIVPKNNSPVEASDCGAIRSSSRPD